MDEERDIITDSDESVRLRAYQIWEEQGRPEGKHESHWWQALEELAIIPAAQLGAAVGPLRTRTSLRKPCRTKPQNNYSDTGKSNDLGYQRFKMAGDGSSHARLF